MNSNNIFSLNGKVALVTGAAKGNGRAIAEGLLYAGAVVYFVDILKDVLENTVAAQENHNARAFSADISNAEELNKMIDAIINNSTKIDILVNNAGISISEPSEEYSIENWDKTHNINLRSAFILSQLCAKQMIRQGGGVIINITSLGAEQGFPNNPAYVSSKGALKQLSKALARDWAKYGIRVNNIGPGYMQTDMTKKSWTDKKLSEERIGRTILERWGKPQDLAGAAVFLASNASKYVTGQDIYVDGGWLAKGL